MGIIRWDNLKRNIKKEEEFKKMGVIGLGNFRY